MRHSRGGRLRLLSAALLVAAAVSGCAAADLPSPQDTIISCTVAPALVNLTTTLAYDSANGMVATGIVVDSSGHVVTNNHVVVGAATIDAGDVGTGKHYSATVVGTDIVDDIAVLKLAGATRLPAARLGDSATVAAGQRVFALGNARGTCRAPALSSGTVRQLNASTVASHVLNGDSLRLTGLIRTSAPLEQGVSGGALVNGDGRVVGILAAGYRDSSDDYQGFAIPINRVRSIARQILAGRSSGTVHVGPTASIGVEAAASANLPPGLDLSSAIVRHVLRGSPADRLGLQPGCQIVALAKHRITSARALIDFLHASEPGQVVAIKWFDHRTATPRTATIRLVAGPPL